MYLISSGNVLLSQVDAIEFIEEVETLNRVTAAKVDNLDTDLLKEFSHNAQGDICPVQAFIGGIASQEVMKVSDLI